MKKLNFDFDFGRDVTDVSRDSTSLHVGLSRSLLDSLDIGLGSTCPRG